jgi:molybdopterin/thiamine biosynthesis adenylyltransferase
VGVLGVLPGVVGLLQANEVVKILLGRGEPLVGRLLAFDALETRFQELRVRPDPACPACAPGARPELVDYEAFCADAR